MGEARTMSAAEFAAACLEVIDRVACGEWERVAITEGERVVAELVAPPTTESEVKPPHGLFRGSVKSGNGADLAALLTKYTP